MHRSPPPHHEALLLGSDELGQGVGDNFGNDAPVRAVAVKHAQEKGLALPHLLHNCH